MFRESNSALSWNSIPILLRISNNSCSRITVRSRPNAKTLPESGLMSPNDVLSSTVFPLPAAPRITRDSPSHASNETSAEHVRPFEADGDVLEAQDGRGGVGHYCGAWLTKILVSIKSRMKIRIVAATTACVVALPTPWVPPVVRRP